MISTQEDVARNGLLICGRLLAELYRFSPHIIKQQHVMLYFLHNFCGKFRIDSILTALVCVCKAHTFARFERLEQTSIYGVTTINKKVYHGGVSLVQRCEIGHVKELRSNYNSFH
jgi:hypothetical protein